MIDSPTVTCSSLFALRVLFQRIKTHFLSSPVFQFLPMDSSTSTEVIFDFPPIIKVFKDGRVERYFVGEPAPAGLDPTTGVLSKDVMISPGVGARIFMPEIKTPGRKLPLLVHYHGGGFSIGSAFDTETQKLLAPLVIQANIIIISIDYRLAPEHLLPIAYDDSWSGLQWVASHATGAIKLVGLKIIGMLIVHPFFGSKQPNEPDLYKYICPTSAGFDHDPKLNPEVDPNLKQMACDKVIVMVAENDSLRSRGEFYYEALVKSGWGGTLEFFETKGEGHCFHVFYDNGNAQVLKKKMVDFINKD
ncbi:hypothetical protein PTKIN_Ptkin02bG0183300 [Pterospermum kingtungense]